MCEQTKPVAAAPSGALPRPKVGLALGGGGARGAAHVGILRVLERAGIPIDCIAGTSSGAMVGAAYASGLPVDEIEAIFSRVRVRDLFRPIWAPDGWLDNAPLARSFERVVGQYDVSELRIPFAAMAADASTGEPVALRSGPLTSVLRASTAIPCLVRPFDWEGRRLIDGGVVHKVPVRLARELGAQIVIAVDLSRPYVWQRRRIYHPLAFLMRVIEIMDQRLVEGELTEADVALQPHVDCGSFDFRRYREQVQRGEHAALEALDQIRRALAAAESPVAVE